MRCFYEYTTRDENGDILCMCGLSDVECAYAEREQCGLYWKEVKNKENSCMRCKHVLTDYGPCVNHSMFYCRKNEELIDPDDMPCYMCEYFEEA